MTKTHLDCPHCGHKGCYTEWPNGNYYCHSCGTKGVQKVTMEEHKKEYPKALKPYRNLSKKSVETYKVETLIDDTTGEDYGRLYHYPHKTKQRILPKDFSQNAGFTNDHLFGMDLFNAGSYDSVTVVEGEDDAPAAWEMLGGTTPVVAIPGASISDKLLKNCHKYLDSFKRIVVATDSDDAGNAAAERLAAAFPNKVYRVSLTLHKDAMEYLENGKRTDFKFAWSNASKYVPEFDTSTPDAYLKLFEEGEDDNFISSGIEAYDDQHLGLFQGHVTMFTAPEGTGKTELFHFFEHHMIKNYPDVPFASCHLEETKKRTLLGWVSYDLDKNVTRKDLIKTPKEHEEVQDSIKKLTKSENAHLFSIGIDEDPMILLDRIKYYVTVFGCKYIFVEPIQDLAQQYSGGETTERFLSKIAVGLARIATHYKVGIIIIAHENDEGQVSDCRKLSKQASVVVRLERDVDNEDPMIRNVTTLRSKKNRPASYVGYAGQIIFNPDTFKLREHHGTT